MPCDERLAFSIEFRHRDPELGGLRVFEGEVQRHSHRLGGRVVSGPPGRSRFLWRNPMALGLARRGRRQPWRQGIGMHVCKRQTRRGRLENGRALCEVPGERICRGRRCGGNLVLFFQRKRRQAGGGPEKGGEAGRKDAEEARQLVQAICPQVCSREPNGGGPRSCGKRAERLLG